jgi:hypothetical protein
MENASTVAMVSAEPALSDTNYNGETHESENSQLPIETNQTNAKEGCKIEESQQDLSSPVSFIQETDPSEGDKVRIAEGDLENIHTAIRIIAAVVAALIYLLRSD